MRAIIADYLRLMRLPGSAGIALVPVFGAISTNAFSFSTLIPLFFIGLFSNIGSFVLNDIIDVELDKLSKDLSMRALVKGTISKKNAAIIFLACFSFVYTLIFVFFYRNHISFYLGLLFVLLADALGFIYNIYGKRIIGSDFLLALAESLFFLFGALMVIPHAGLEKLTWILFILVFTHVLYMNAIQGGLKDADHDYIRQVKNIALATGVRVTKNKKVFIPRSFKAFALGIRSASIFLVFTPFLLFGLNYKIWQILLLIAVVVLLLYASIKMLNITFFDRNKLRKIIMIQLWTRYSFIPIIFISIIGPLYAFLLLILPFAWYISFSLLMGEKLLKPQI